MNKKAPAAPWLVVIDRAVRDWRPLLAAAPRGEPILLLEPQQNGLEQIDSVLRRMPCNTYGGIAVVGEATAARLQLGNGSLDGAALERHAPLLQRWQQWLQAGAGLRLYGCRLAAGAAGRALLQRLTDIAGLPAAASARPVGPAALGGSISLEHTTGAIAAAPAWLEAALALQLGHVLGEEPQLAVQLAALHADDPAFLTPISGQLQLPDGDGLNVAALQSDHDATAAANNAWLISTELGSFHFWPDGRWSYAADPAFDWANRGSNNDSIGTDTILLATTAGSSVALRIDVLAGVNNAPTLTISELDAKGAVIEANQGSAGITNASGQLSASDPDAYAPLRWELAGNATTSYGTFSLDAVSGAWIYTLNNGAPATQALSSGQSVTDTVVAVVRDEFGASATQALAVTILGANDAATVSSAVVALTETNAPLSASGTLTSSDVDNPNNTFTASTTVGSKGTVSIDADGAWTFTANSAFDSLNVGDSVSETFNVSSVDGTASTVAITINGSNDAATVSSATVALDETNAALTTGGTLTSTDVDNPSNTFTAATTVGSKGTFSIDAAGAWTFTANSAFDSLKAGTSVSETFNVSSVDGTASTVAVTINGTNDAATISGETSGALNEAGVFGAGISTSAGVLAISDPDSGEARFQMPPNLDGTYGSFSFDALSGVWSYSLDNSRPATEQLRQGDQVRDTLLVRSFDGSASQTISVTISGSNDAATISGSTSASLLETNAPQSVSGELSVSDPDAGQNLVAAIPNQRGSYGAFSISAAGGWTYSADANNQLTAGQVVSDVFSVSAIDGSASASVTITITGSNDAATIGGQSSGAVSEAGVTGPGSPTAAGLLTISDPDSGEARFQMPPNLAGTYGSFSFDALGAWSYALDNARPVTDQLQQGQTVVDALTVRSSDNSATRTIAVTITGSADAQRKPKRVKGTVIDGYIAGATVFADLNGNGQRDGDEPATLTDAQGNYSFDTSLTEEEAGAVRVMASGGTDVTTGLAFNGTLMAPLEGSVITPLTSLVVGLIDASGGSRSVAEATAVLNQALSLPAGVDLSRFDPLAVAAGAPGAALALRVQQAGAQVANLLAVALALGHSGGAVIAQLSRQLEGAAAVGATVNLGDSAVLRPLLGGNAAAATQLAFSNLQVAAAGDLAGVVQGQLRAQKHLVANLQTMGQGMPAPGVVGDRRSNRVVGGSADEVIRGFGVGDGSRGRRQRDRLTGAGGNDLFQLGDERGSFYDDGRSRTAGKKDYAWISDFNNGDQIQLHGSANDYLLRQVRVRQQGVTALYRNDGRGRGANPEGWDRRDELIGYVQLADGAALNLLDPGQVMFAGPLNGPAPTNL